MPDRSEPRVALDKVAFLTAFVPYLAAQGPVPVAEAAEHFGYTEEYIRRAAAQLPLMGLPGEEGFGLANDLFDIDYDALERDDELILTNRVAIDDVPRLSAREAAAIIAGLELLGQDAYIAASPEYASLRGKLVTSAAGEPEAPTVEPPRAPGFEALRAAIGQGRQVRFRYRTSGAAESEVRTVDPVRIEALDATYHLRGWCHARQAFRTFRLDRIEALEILDAPSAHDARDLVDATDGFAASEGAVAVTIEFDAAAIDLVEGYRPERIEHDKGTGRATMTILVTAFAVVRRILADLPSARVIGPQEVSAAAQAWTQDALSRYRASRA